MHVTADRLHLSPSDVTAFLACEHLTTLSLAHARGEIERPEVENEQAELIFRKGIEHERAYLESLRADGLTVLEIEDPRGDYEGAARATADAIRAGEADVDLPGRPRGRAAGAASPTSCCGSRTAPTRRSTRSSPARPSPRTSSSSSTTTSSSHGSRGASRSESTSSSAPASRRRSARRSSPRTTGASAPGSRSSSPIRRRPSRTRSPTATSASSSRSATRAGTRSTT